MLFEALKTFMEAFHVVDAENNADVVRSVTEVQKAKNIINIKD